MAELLKTLQLFHYGQIQQLMLFREQVKTFTGTDMVMRI